LKVQVRYFALLREMAGSEGEELALDSGATVSGLRRELEALRPEVAEILREARFAVNQDFVGDSFELTDGDLVAVIPPVSGG
jgi:molybdopterin synthase catalytic subunit